MAKYRMTDRTTLGASFGYVKCVNNEIQQHYPPYQVKLDVTSRFLEDRLLVCLNYVFNSSYTQEINPIISEYYEHPRHLVDASVVYKVGKNLRIKGVVQNLFADETPSSGGFLMNVPSKYSLGYDETRAYLSGEITF